MTTLRQQKQEQTRAALLKKGEEEVRRVGIGGVSIRQVCQNAGYTLGAFYSNFKSRDEFLLTILDLFMGRLLASLRDLVRGTIARGLDSSRQDIASWVDAVRHDRVYVELMLEYMFYAKHDADFREVFRPFVRSWWDQTARAIETLFTGLGLRPRVPFQLMAVHFSALWQGLALQEQLHDPKIEQLCTSIFLDDFMRIVEESEPVAPGAAEQPSPDEAGTPSGVSGRPAGTA